MATVSIICSRCGKETCGCKLCAKEKANSGLCNFCYKKSTVEKSQPDGAQNPGEAKP